MIYRTSDRLRESADVYEMMGLQVRTKYNTLRIKNVNKK